VHLRGGCSGTSTRNTGTFKDLVKGKAKAQTKLAIMIVPMGPYIMEQKPENPILSILSIPEVNSLYSDLSNSAIICRFNGFWPNSDVLHQWIHTAWTSNCEIYLCPKGFFIVRFSIAQEQEHILNMGPWFWGSTGLFITPWFPEFDANNMVVSKIPVWVRLHNLPLHF